MSFAAYLPILLFGLFALMPSLTGSDDIDDDAMEPDEPVDPIDPIDPVDPVDPDTLGATFAQDDAGVTIEFGENETGTLAVFTYVDTEDDAENFVEVHEARYYLVPEGTEWPDNTSETQFNVPVPADYDDPDGIYELEDFEDAFGLELLGTVDLLAAGNDEPTTRDMADALPDLTANRDAEYYYLEANTDGDDLTRFLQEGWIETRGGLAETVVTESTVGTDEADWISTATAGLTIEGGDGDDFLDADALNVSLFGGAGADEITATQAGAVIEGGAGEDEIDAVDALVFGGDDFDRIDISGTGDSSAFGDAGDDILRTTSTGTTELFGGEGDDNLQAVLAGSAAIDASLFGGDGDDFLAIGNGAVGFGGDGQDTLQLDAGGTAFGGEGADTLNISDFFDAEGGTMVASGGAGSDAFNVSVRNVFGEPGAEIFAQIEDFDSEEDLLSISAVNPNDEIVGVNTVEDPNGTFTDVNIDFRNQLDEIITVTVRLTGATGITAGDVLLA